LTRRNSSAR